MVSDSQIREGKNEGDVENGGDRNPNVAEKSLGAERQERLQEGLAFKRPFYVLVFSNGSYMILFGLLPKTVWTRGPK